MVNGSMGKNYLFFTMLSKKNLGNFSLKMVKEAPKVAIQDPSPIDPQGFEKNQSNKNIA